MLRLRIHLQWKTIENLDTGVVVPLNTPELQQAAARHVYTWGVEVNGDEVHIIEQEGVDRLIEDIPELA